MDKVRTRLYEVLGARIGRTPLVKYQGYVPNRNVIWIKREHDNPFGSHYDRVYLALFNYYEESGVILPGDRVLETTSGAAGVSFAAIGRLLNYECFVALPAGGEKAREKAILEHLPNRNHLILTPADEYIRGFPGFLKQFLSEHSTYFFLNHSMGRFDKQARRYRDNDITLRALEGIANETVEELKCDFFIPAVGNGSSVLGPGRLLHVRGAKIIPFETFQSAAMYALKYPGKYEQEFGINPGSLSRHKLPGTSFQGIDFPHIRGTLEENLIDDVILVTDRWMDEEYYSRTGRNDTKELVHWDIPVENHEESGRTTKAGINVALDLANKVRDKNLLIIGYDKSERYDS